MFPVSGFWIQVKYRVLFMDNHALKIPVRPRHRMVHECNRNAAW